MHKSQVLIQRSCGQPWAEMRGGPRRRFCEACQHDVVNLSALTEREASEIVARARRDGARLCVRYELDTDGRLEFQAEPRKAAAGLRGHLTAGALAALARTAAPLIPVSALLPACTAATTSAPEVPLTSFPRSPMCPLPAAMDSRAVDPNVESGTGLLVLVEDLASGEPVEGATVRVSFDHETIEMVAVTGKSGKAIFTDLEPAPDYSVQIESSGHRTFSRYVEVSPGQITTMEVKLVHNATVEFVGVVCVAPTVDIGDASQGMTLDHEFWGRVPIPPAHWR